jgi:hypothetical protein
VDGQGAVEHSARRGWPLHRAREPAGKWDQGRLAGGGHQKQQADDQGLAFRDRGPAFRPRAGAEQAVEIADACLVVQDDDRQ